MTQLSLFDLSNDNLTPAPKEKPPGSYSNLFQASSAQQIATVFQNDPHDANAGTYCQIISQILKRILPDSFLPHSFDDNDDLIEDVREQFEALLPLVYTDISVTCDNISFFVLSKVKADAFKFFFDMVARWLLPGRRLNISMLFASDFHLPNLSDATYSLYQITIHIDKEVNIEEIRRHLSTFEQELKLGMRSSYYARRIQEIKGLMPDEKTMVIQDHISYLLKRLPQYFDVGVYTEMQHVLVMCMEDFKSVRNSRHLSRIISTMYLFRKQLCQQVQESPDKRFLNLKLFKTKLKTPQGQRAVLGILVGINFLRDNELFEEKHLFKAVQNYVPRLSVVEGSFFANKRGKENICTLYLEVEKNSSGDFTIEEIKILQQELPYDLKDRIEHLMHPVFMPRNEEEIMRNILNLSNQIKYLRDPPQIMVIFDEQTHFSLLFTVIVVRVVTPGEGSIQEQFEKASSAIKIKYIHDRCKMVGLLRKKYAKEATVFRVKVPNEGFLRGDHSIDLNKARLLVTTELQKILGDFRDYNGGMITRQNEVLYALHEALNGKVKYHDLLLENFFYSLQPVSVRTTLEIETLASFFNLLLKAIDKSLFQPMQSELLIEKSGKYLFALLTAHDRQLKEEILNFLTEEKILFAHSYVTVYDIPRIGFILLQDDAATVELFTHGLTKLTSQNRARQ